jgi:hypothetical protein
MTNEEKGATPVAPKFTDERMGEFTGAFTSDDTRDPRNA